MKGESNSKARGIVILIAALLIFQIGTFVWKTIEERKGEEIEFGTIVGEDGIWRNDDTDAGNKYDGGQGTKSGRGKKSGQNGKVPNKSEKQAHLFLFNPNTITLDSLVMLGFSPKQAQTILNYRNKGGRFRKKEDFAKMYVVSEEKYAALQQWIDIPVVADKGNTKSKEETKNLEGAGQSSGSGVAGLESASKRSGGKLKTAADTVKSEKKAAYVPYIPQVGKTQWICNLNTADSAQLVKLYGIGPYFAKKILQYRQRLGGSFADARQLLEIEGIDMEKYTKFEQKVVVNEEDIKKFTIEELDRKFMEQHPYIGAYAARGIILYKEGKAGKITIEELVKENILLPEPASRLKFYIK